MSNLLINSNNYTETENGALSYKSTLNNILDLFAMGGSLRTREEKEIHNLVEKAYNEDPKLTLACLFYLRDIREGQGEKRTFTEAFKYLFKSNKISSSKFYNFMMVIKEFGYWKDLFKFDESMYMKPLCEYIKNEGKDDLLLFKYLPSVGGSQNKLANRVAKGLGLTSKEYRKLLTSKRAKLKLVETSMCSNNWDKIEYEHVPSKANLIYRNAFRKHDEARYSDFINKAVKNDGSIKVNTKTLAPYEIVQKYYNNGYDDTLQALWNNLPDYTNGSNSIVVADSSGSMFGLPRCIAYSLAIYFAERNKGKFHNETISFSRYPKFVTFKDSDNLKDKLKKIALDIVDDTNLQAVFDMVLKIGVDYKLPQEEMPKNIYIISDMEFNSCTDNNTNFENIKRKYQELGYEMPNLIFWNVDSRQNNVLVKYNDKGVCLVSGSSPNTFKMAIEGELDPVKFMMNTLNKDRYISKIDLI